MASTSRAQVWIGATGFVVFVVAMTWMLTHRKPALPPVAPPKILSLVAKQGTASRPLAEGATLSRDDLIDFEIEVSELAYVYVFKIESSVASLAFGHQVSDDPWDRGAYAPNFKDDVQGMRFNMPGDVALQVVTSPLPLAQAAQWTLENLDHLAEQCPRCASARVKLKLEAPPMPGP